MSSVCEITGLSEENVAKLSYLHRYLVTGNEVPSPDEKALNGFIKPLENTVSSNRIHNSEQKRKDSLLKHLEKSIASKFEGAKISPFGSAESGLSLKGGDFDLCLQIPNVDEKKTIKRIGGMLRGQGMEKVQTIARAKVPIVKFTDPRSGLNVDISINNTLALYNTRLLSTYAKMDKRVKDLAICVKHWALHRNVSDSVNGTFSSYAWSVLVINHLQEQGVIPNLQSGENRTLIEIDGNEFDITVNEDVSIDQSNQQNIAELTMSFFRSYATRNWDNEVISIRNGKPISRDDKGWMNEEPTALEIFNSDKENPGRMGEHHLAVEDPSKPTMT